MEVKLVLMNTLRLCAEVEAFQLRAAEAAAEDHAEIYCGESDGDLQACPPASSSESCVP